MFLDPSRAIRVILDLVSLIGILQKVVIPNRHSCMRFTNFGEGLFRSIFLSIQETEQLIGKKI